MAEYIERELIYGDFEKCNDNNPKWTPGRVKTLIARQPTVDVAPVRRGRWIIDGVYVVCSVCNRLTLSPIVKQLPTFRYCPNCGAKLDLEE